jgi:hypothetical protein
MVGVAPRARNVQRSIPALEKSVVGGNEYYLAHGTDLVGSINSLAAGHSVGDILLTQLISPSEFPGTRLNQYSALFQRYRIKKIHFRYEPMANATQSGQVIGYADFDVDNELLEDNPDNLRIAAAHQGQVPNQIWQEASYDMGQAGTFTDLYTESGGANADDRLSIQGVFYLIAASTIAGDLPLGNIYIDYEVLFSIPYLDPARTGLMDASGVFASTEDVDPGSIPELTASGNFSLSNSSMLEEASWGPQGGLHPGRTSLGAGAILTPPLFSGQRVVMDFTFMCAQNRTLSDDLSVTFEPDIEVVDGGSFTAVKDFSAWFFTTTSGLKVGDTATFHINVEVTETCLGGILVTPMFSGAIGIASSCPVQTYLSVVYTPPTSITAASKMRSNIRKSRRESALIQRLSSRLRTRDFLHQRQQNSKLAQSVFQPNFHSHSIGIKPDASKLKRYRVDEESEADERPPGWVPSPADPEFVLLEDGRYHVKTGNYTIPGELKASRR